MISITVIVGNTSFPLLYRTEEAAKAAVETIYDGAGFSVSDDFGQTFHGTLANIRGLLVEDLDKSRLARIEMGLHNARTQIAMNKQAETDPMLRQARMQQGPSVISPMGNGGFRA